VAKFSKSRVWVFGTKFQRDREVSYPYFWKYSNFDITVWDRWKKASSHAPNQLDLSGRFDTIPACDGKTHRVGQKSKLLILSEYVNKTEKIVEMRTNTNIYRENGALSDIFS